MSIELSLTMSGINSGYIGNNKNIYTNRSMYMFALLKWIIFCAILLFPITSLLFNKPYFFSFTDWKDESDCWSIKTFRLQPKIGHTSSWQCHRFYVQWDWRTGTVPSLVFSVGHNNIVNICIISTWKFWNSSVPYSIVISIVIWEHPAFSCNPKTTEGMGDYFCVIVFSMWRNDWKWSVLIMWPWTLSHAPAATHCSGGPHHTQGTSRCVDESGRHPWVLAEPTDQILCTTDLGTGHQH